MEEDLGMTKKNNNADSALTYHNNYRNDINPLLSHPSEASSMGHIYHPNVHYRSSSSWCSSPPPLQKQNKQHFPIDKGSDHYRYDDPWQQHQQQGQLYLRRENHHFRVLPHPVHHGYHVYHHRLHRYRSTIYDDGDYCGGVSFSKEQNRFVGLPVLSSSKSQPRQQQKQKHQCTDIGFTQQDGKAIPPLPPQKQQQEKGYQQQQCIDINFSMEEEEEEEGQKQHELQKQCVDISHSQEGNKPFAARPQPLLVLQKQQHKQRQQNVVPMSNEDNSVTIRQVEQQVEVTVEDDSIHCHVDDEDDRYGSNMMNESQMDTTSEQFLPKVNATFRIHHNHNDGIWMGMFQKIVAYKKVYEHTVVPRNYSKDPQLGLWVTTQRKRFKNDELLPNQLSLLNSIRFEWEYVRGKKTNTCNELWMKMFQKLITYKEQNENTKVPAQYAVDLSFGHWVGLQRTLFNHNKLREDRHTLLNDIDFDWGSGSRQFVLWMRMFQKLVAYKDQYENTKVPRGYDEDPRLGIWVANQRTIFKRNKMPEDRITLLNGIDFDWGRGLRQLSPPVPWMAMYERLVVYKREHNGFTNGLFSQNSDKQLGLWVSYQRAAYKNKTLSDDRISLLDTIDSDWNTVRRDTKRKVSSTISSAAANTTNERSNGEENTTRRFINSDSNNKIDMMPSPRKKLCTSKSAMPVITKRSFAAADYKIPATIGWSNSSSASSSVSAYTSHDGPVSDNVDNDRKEYDDDDEDDDDDDDDDNGFIVI